MPRLFHRPPKYALHKSTKQAIVSLFGERIYLGPYGSRKSHQRYQAILKKWEKARHDEWSPDAKPEDGPPKKLPKVVTLTPAMLREKRLAGSPVSISELIYVYRQYTREYYRKNGEVTREAGAIDDALRLLRKHHAMASAFDFGPLALDELRNAMIDEVDWSRKYINKQVNRIRGMFKWASSKEIVEASVPAAPMRLRGTIAQLDTPCLLRKCNTQLRNREPGVRRSGYNRVYRR